MIKGYYIDKNTCTVCGGKCCYAMPGAAHPIDFEPNIETSIDWFEGDPRPDKDELDKCYYIRPATVAGKGIIFDPSEGGQCVLLTDFGCSLSPDRRPFACRMLIPSKLNQCMGAIPKSRTAIAWLDYQDMLLEIGNKLSKTKVAL